MLINKRSRENAGENPPEHQEKAGRQRGHRQPGAEVCGLPHEGHRPAGALHRGGRLGPGAASSSPGRGVSGHHARAGQNLNCLKADYAKIFKSEIITDLLKVLGCGVEVHDKHAKDMAAFDLANLRWNKVVICTDADVDGFQIRTLILTMLLPAQPPP